MRIPVKLVDARGAAPAVEFRWDADTDILTAAIADAGATHEDIGSGMTGVVEIEGSDGSWINLEVRSGQTVGVEVAVWPDVAIRPALRSPDATGAQRVVFPAQPSQTGLASMEVETRIAAEADAAERTVHFRIGQARAAAVVRAATDLLLEVDEAHDLAGIWLLNVPPFPSAP